MAKSCALPRKLLRHKANHIDGRMEPTMPTQLAPTSNAEESRLPQKAASRHDGTTAHTSMSARNRRHIFCCRR